MNRRWIVLSAVVVVAVAGLVVAADRVTAAVIASKMGERLGCGGTADVHGFPVLTQLASGRLSDVTADFTTADARVHLEAQDIPISGDGAVGGVTVTATVPWTTVSSQLSQNGLPATAHAEGARMAIEMAGGLGSVLAAVRVDGAALQVEPEIVRFLGQEMSATALRRTPVAGLLDARKVPLPAMPAGLLATGADVGEPGLTIHAAGKDVAISGNFAGFGAGCGSG